MTAFTDAVRAALRRIGCTRNSPLRLLAQWPGSILSRRASGGLDGATDDQEVSGPGGFGNLAALVGLPGCRVIPRDGQRVRVGFREGSTEGTEVTSFEQDAGADRGIARQGDKALLGTATYTAVVSPVPTVTLTFTPASSPYAPSAQAPIVIQFLGAVISGWLPGVPLELYAWIETGSPEVMLRKADSEVIP